MQTNIDNQVQNSDTYTEIKYPKGDKLFFGQYNGSVVEFSIAEKKLVHSPKILDGIVNSMVKTYDNKSQLVCSLKTGFKQLHVPTCKDVKGLNVGSFHFDGRRQPTTVVVTHDNKFLIAAATNGIRYQLRMFCVRTKKHIRSWSGGNSDKAALCSMSVSRDNKYQLQGHQYGELGIYDLQKHKKLNTIAFILGSILEVAFLSDNETAFVCDYNGNIQRTKLSYCADSKNKSDFTEDSTNVSKKGTRAICLTKDEKYLIVGSQETLSLYDTTTREVTKEFIVTDCVMGISLIQDGQKAIIAQYSGDLSILHLENMELEKIAENVTDNEKLFKFTVI